MSYAGRDRRVDPATPWRKNGLGRYADEGSVRGRHYESSEPLSGFSGFGIAPMIVAAGIAELKNILGKKHTGLPTHYARYAAAVQSGNTSLASTLLEQARGHANDPTLPDRAQWQIVYQHMLSIGSDGGSQGVPNVPTISHSTDVQNVLDAALATPEGQNLVNQYGPEVAKAVVQQQQQKAGNFVGKNLPYILGGGILLLFLMRRR